MCVLFFRGLYRAIFPCVSCDAGSGTGHGNGACRRYGLRGNGCCKAPSVPRYELCGRPRTECYFICGADRAARKGGDAVAVCGVRLGSGESVARSCPAEEACLLSLKSGFTLIEMMVAMAAASIVVLSAYAFLGASARTFNLSVKAYGEESAALVRSIQQSQQGILLIKTGKNKRASRMTRPN